MKTALIQTLRKHFLFFPIFLLLGSSLMAKKDNYWENQNIIGVSKEAPTAWLYPFQDFQKAIADNLDNSLFIKSLNKTWKFF